MRVDASLSAVVVLGGVMPPCADMHNSMRVARAEVFGLVLQILLPSKT